MPARDPNTRAKVARVAALARHHGPADPDIPAARRDLRAARLEAHIRRVVAEWPPLDVDARDRLALLLRGGDAS